MIHFVIIIFFVWRFTLFLIAYLSGLFFSFQPRFPYSDIYLISSRLPHFIWSFANFDGVHYLTIAKNFYSANYTQVFFPLYPLLIRNLAKILPGNNLLLTGLILSNLFFLLSLLIFWKLLKLDYDNKQIRWVLLVLILFPTSFFSGSVYTESLFLFLVLGSFYFARLKKWYLSGIFGGLASATRLVGIFLLPALLWEWHKDKCKMQNAKCKITIKNLNLSEFHRYIFHFSFLIFNSPVTYLVPLGLIAYMLYLQITYGDMLYFWHVQPVFGAERTGNSIILLPQVFYRYLKIFVLTDITSTAFWTAFLEFISVIFVIILLIKAQLMKIRLSYLIFSWMVLIVPTLTGTFSSMPRYVLAVIPIYIILGLIKNIRLKIILLFVFACLLSFFTVIFTSGRWIA